MDETQTSGDEDFFPGCSSVHQKRSEPEPSCVSMRSDVSKELPIVFKSEDTWPGLRPVQQKTSEPEPSCVSMRSDVSKELPIVFKSEDTRPELRPVQQKTSEPEPSCVSMRSDVSKELQIKIKSEDTRPGLSNEVLNTFRSNLKIKFEHLYEGTVMLGNPTLLNEIYTELYITEKQKMDVFDLKQFIGAQHKGNEVLQYLLPVFKDSRSVQ
ncbi:hypothetical protein QQF64_036304 [Cirrhinus molitorella]|uniref:FISNA domain-containing protein n=1 Tax=Cirrhinus molitorella TaxID=172907 RepID=A0ABR3NJ02_9TELE